MRQCTTLNAMGVGSILTWGTHTQYLENSERQEWSYFSGNIIARSKKSSALSFAIQLTIMIPRLLILKIQVQTLFYFFYYKGLIHKVFLPWYVKQLNYYHNFTLKQKIYVLIVLWIQSRSSDRQSTHRS